MEITTLQQSGARIELAVKGRLDAYWADHLAKHLEEVVREGARGIRLNLENVNYISSMGIRVLVDNYKKLGAIHGSFAIADPSPAVSKVLALSGLLESLLTSVPIEAPADEPMTLVSRAMADYEVATLDAAAHFRCRAIGKPGKLANGAFDETACRPVSFPRNSVAVGLGAFGSGFDDARSRFGEFLAVAGSAAYQPTDGSNVADSMGSAEALVPEMQVLYALACEGNFSHLLRFHAKGEKASIGISELLGDALAITKTKRAAVVMVAESTGLLGAWLRKSPAGDSARDLFAHPEIRQWLSFTPDRLHSRALALVAGMVDIAPDPALASFVRPIGALQGHLHSALFSYQPMQSGRVDVHETVGSLFAKEKLHAVLHLLSDDRGASGAGESEFIRGACWIGPVADVVEEAGA